MSKEKSSSSRINPALQARTGNASDAAIPQEESPQSLRMPFRHSAHAGVHVALILAYFLPGGWLWNRADLWPLGIPLSVWAVAVVLPLLIAANTLLWVRGHWRDDAAWKLPESPRPPQDAA
ncbi:MAG: hypothetical protein M5U26_21885 [Planctomycetota bacterium]|nr:hypothetical protein [Planctomycetota bacterium]